MAGKLTVNPVQINDSATATNNFVLKADNLGGVKLSRGNDGATTQDILTVDASGKVTLPNNPAIFSGYFQSSNQTLTAGGALTIAHGLGSKPILLQLYLVNIIAEGGYTIGDEVYYPNNHSNSAVDSLGVSVVPDATNLNVRMGANPSFATILNKTTGALLNITNANWRLIIRAWV